MATRTLTDGQALDRMSAWLCEPNPDGQWGSACDFIELAALLLERTGRGSDPAPCCEGCGGVDVVAGVALCLPCLRAEGDDDDD